MSAAEQIEDPRGIERLIGGRTYRYPEDAKPFPAQIEAFWEHVGLLVSKTPAQVRERQRVHAQEGDAGCRDDFGDTDWWAEAWALAVVGKSKGLRVEKPVRSPWLRPSGGSVIPPGYGQQSSLATGKATTRKSPSSRVSPEITVPWVNLKPLEELPVFPASLFALAAVGFGDGTQTFTGGDGQQGGEGGDTPQEGAVPRAAPLEARPVRVALDWLRILYRAYPSSETWHRLVEHALHGLPVSLAQWEGGELAFDVRVARADRELVLTHKGSGIRIVVRARPGGYSEAIDHDELIVSTGDAAVFDLSRGLPEAIEDHTATAAEGDVKDPNWRFKQRQHATVLEQQKLQRVYGIELDLQGSLLSASATGFEPIEWVRAAVESYLLPGLTREQLAPHTFPGRFDVAFDTEIRGPLASEWIEQRVYHCGDVDRSRGNFVTRARKPRSVVTSDTVDDGSDTPMDSDTSATVGSKKYGRTLYFGSDPQVTIYERDRKTDGDWSLLEPTLRACGWDGESRVLRTEFRISRAWFSDQYVPASAVDSSALATAPAVRMDTLSLDEVLKVMPSIAHTLVDRVRHTEGTETRVRRRPSTFLWESVQSSPALLLRKLERSGDALVALQSRRHAKKVERSRDAGVRALLSLVAIGRSDLGPLSLVESLRQVVGHLGNSEEFAKQQKYTQSVLRSVMLPSCAEDTVGRMPSLEEIEQVRAALLGLPVVEATPPPTSASDPWRTPSGKAAMKHALSASCPSDPADHLTLPSPPFRIAAGQWSLAPDLPSLPPVLFRKLRERQDGVR